MNQILYGLFNKQVTDMENCLDLQMPLKRKIVLTNTVAYFVVIRSNQWNI
jgi:hypothetical protein